MAASRLAWAPALPGFNWTCTKLRNLGGAPARFGVSCVCPSRAEGLVRKKMPAQREKNLAFMASVPSQAKMNRPNCRQEYTDRKSTRLNSSHSQISYAVFCLKKKKKKE